LCGYGYGVQNADPRPYRTRNHGITGLYRYELNIILYYYIIIYYLILLHGGKKSCLCARLYTFWAVHRPFVIVWSGQLTLETLPLTSSRSQAHHHPHPLPLSSLLPLTAVRCRLCSLLLPLPVAAAPCRLRSGYHHRLHPVLRAATSRRQCLRVRKEEWRGGRGGGVSDGHSKSPLPLSTPCNSP
jgi:hypothetical protein